MKALICILLISISIFIGFPLKGTRWLPVAGHGLCDLRGLGGIRGIRGILGILGIRSFLLPLLLLLLLIFFLLLLLLPLGFISGCRRRRLRLRRRFLSCARCPATETVIGSTAFLEAIVIFDNE